MRFLATCLTAAFLATSSIAAPLEVSKVKVECAPEGGDCSDLASALRLLARGYSDMEHFKRVVELYALNDGIYSFQYALAEEEGNSVLRINLGVKKLLDELYIRVKDDPGLDLPTILPLREGDYVDDKSLFKTKELLLETAKSQGYPLASARFDLGESEEGVVLRAVIDPGRPVVLKEVRIHSDSPFLAETAGKALSRHRNKNFYLQSLKNSLEELRQLFIDYGYYLADLNLDYEKTGRFSAAADVSIKSNGLHVFYPKGNLAISTADIKSALKNSVLAYKRKLPAETVAQRIQSMYAEIGYVNAKAYVDRESGQNKENEEVSRYNIRIEEGVRTKISEIRFIGNSALGGKLLRSAFYENAPEVVKSGFFQRDYFEDFAEIARSEYITRGYVNVLVEEPRVRFSRNNAYLVYRMREGARAVVSRLEIKGVGDRLEESLLLSMSNRESKAFNPVSFKDDLERIETLLKQEGYYFARIKNKTGPGIVGYNNDNSSVAIAIEVETGEKLEAGQIIIIGNRKTKNKLIKRELSISSGDLVTREAIQRSRTNLLGLGIFSSVLIEPVPGESGRSDILVSVREKDFGLVELAPGIRTDIGLKLSANVSYNNLEGMNKRVAFKGRVNRRFNLNSLDERRREESSSLLEYDLAVNYSENNLFHSETDFAASLSTSRKRFFSFDADIQRVNVTFNREFASWFSASLRPQYENIEQFDATNEIDEGTFKIGSLTPGATFDFRNNRINPTSGAWFNMSVEVANPALLSQDNEDLTINYYKFVSRNRFYIPFSGGTLAMSLAGGAQENLAAKGKGYIPNIKVFRLNGADIVRGFEDDEINRLPGGEDISEIRVDNLAYMAVLKIEPRVFLSDTSMLGVFYDAGRVFVDSFDTGELRSSVGLTFKYLTPVGSLDFDYGIKLLRKTYDDGMVDSPGRLHVSIGFF